MDKNKKDKKSILVFIDEDNTKKTIYVNILEIGSFVRFRTKEGNIISLPATSIIKIKEAN